MIPREKACVGAVKVRRLTCARVMRRPPLSEAWDNKLWGDLWGIAMIVMIFASRGAKS